MYAKLFSRITESSLMEEEIPVRYTFVMLLAIADPKGYVIGTDIAIARRLNMPLAQCAECLKELGEPDPDSNSKAEEGRRIIPSDCERGYKIVNYESYRDVRDEDQRREYMRDYMRDYRKRDVNTVSTGKPELAKAEAEAKEEADKESFLRFWSAYPKKKAKPVAEKAFRKVKGATVIDAIIAALEIEKGTPQWEKDGGQFIPHPSTWLNQRRWEDEEFTPSEPPRAYFDNGLPDAMPVIREKLRALVSESAAEGDQDAEFLVEQGYGEQGK